MNWTEITIKVKLSDLETAEAIANMTVPYGIYVEDYSDLEESAWEIAHIDLIDESLIEKDRTTALIHIYIEECDNAAEAMLFLEERLRAQKINFSLENASVNDANWNENWKKYFKVTEIGDRLTIVPSWERYDNKENRTILNIDPGAAFGTGTHATTSLCLELLEEYAKPSTKTLDIGCGSGILAVASVLLGSDFAFGVDIDAQSVKTAKENAEKNNVSDKTEFVVGDLAEKVSGKYNIVCANIVADVIIRLLPDVKKYMTDDGVIIISGIIDSRAQDVLKSVSQNGFCIVGERRRENWCAFTLKSI